MSDVFCALFFGSLFSIMIPQKGDAVFKRFLAPGVLWVSLYAAFITAGCLPLLSNSAASSVPSATSAPDTPVPATTSATPTPTSGAAADEATSPFSVLVFSKTAGFRHDSIPAGIAMIEELGSALQFNVTATEDATRFTDESLAAYQVVIFLNTTGDLLNAEQEAAFEQFIQQGGGFVGIHAASDTEYDWPWYGGLVGAYFAGHPAIQPATLYVTDPTHRSTRGLPAAWNRTDEWYNFRDQPGSEVNILVNLDEESYEGGTMGANHPLSWYQVYDGGRSWYTAMGHTSASYAEPLFRDHVAGGILWAAGRTEQVSTMLPIVIR